MDFFRSYPESHAFFFNCSLPRKVHTVSVNDLPPHNHLGTIVKVNIQEYGTNTTLERVFFACLYK